jgi:DNA replication protein DnaC
MIKGYSTEIEHIYDNLRTKEASDLLKRKEEIQKNLPRVLDLERQIAKLCIQLSINLLKNLPDRDDYLNSIRTKITDLRIMKSELLVQNGYGIDYLDMHYKCTKCKDTGYLGSEKCSCYKQNLVHLYYLDSDLKNILEISNFDNFNFEYYSSHKNNDEPESPRKNMEKTVTKAMNFIKNFNSTNENLLFFGSSGTGKTFLSHCIAKELLDIGTLVVYRTAEELIQNLRHVRLENDQHMEEFLVNCDLLIIDDLGTEQINTFSKTELFNLLNKKLLKGKKMLVSTNYALEELSRTYSERIISRLFGNFNVCKFYGEDIRVKKNLSRLR